MKQIQALISSTVLLLLCACGGGGSSSSTQEDQPIDNSYELGETQTALQDTYEVPSASDVVAHTSTEGGSEWASKFSVAQTTSINQISFSGVAKGELETPLAIATFVVTVYSPNDVNNDIPETTSADELVLQAEAKLIDTISENNYLYSFNIEQNNLYSLDAGDYFISIMDTGVEGFEFQWARENSDNLQTGLTGGASRDSSVSLWESEQWGRNVRIAGTCQSTCVIEGETKGSINIVDGDYQLEAAILDSEAVDPVYFLGVYEGDVSSEVSVVINEQDSTNVTLILSAYNATTWNLTGDGLDNVSNVYVLGYQTGSVSGQSQSSTVTSYSFDEGNYIGTLSEWPDSESTELSEEEKQQALISIEAVTGTVTSYGVVYSTNGIEVH